MPSEWYLMTRPLFNSGFESDEFDIYAQEGFEEILESSVATDVELYDKCLSKGPTAIRAIIENTTNDIFNNAAQRQILCRIGTLRMGQYVKYNNLYWIVATPVDNNKMYEKAILWQCKHTLHFRSPITEEVVDYPVYSVNSTQYGSGETQRTYMKIGSSQQLVYIPFNEETVLIDCGMRFLIDKNRRNPTAYRLTQVDTESYSCGEEDGLIQWTIAESQNDTKTDNFELMVADYYGKSPLSVPDPAQSGYSVSLLPSGGNAEVTFGEELPVAIRFFLDGVETAAFALDIDITEGNDYGVLKDITADGFTIRALDNRDYIGQEIIVTAHNDTLGVSSSLAIQIKGWY